MEVNSTIPGQATYTRSVATSGTNYGIDAEAAGVGATTNIGGWFAASNATNNYALIVPPGYGNVGIGTITPNSNYQLDVLGGARVTGRPEDTKNAATGLASLSVFGFGADKAGFFSGDVFVLGTLTKSAGAFKIDHPVDPANRLLSHSSSHPI